MVRGGGVELKPQSLHATAKLAAEPIASFVLCSLFKRGNKGLVFHRLSGQAAF